MKIVYIAGPYAGPTHDGKSYYQISRNILEAREWAKRVIEAGAFAYASTVFIGPDSYNSL